jgi:hypothetical protein
MYFINNMSDTYYNDRLVGLLAFWLSSLVTTQALWPQSIFTMALRPKISWLTSLYVHLQLGVHPRGITFPSPLFMHYPQCIIYTCTRKILQKYLKICGYSSRMASSCSQVASSGP